MDWWKGYDWWYSFTLSLEWEKSKSGTIFIKERKRCDKDKGKTRKTPFSDNCIYWESRIFYT